MEKEHEEVAVDDNDVLYILKMMLSFHAWYKCGEPFQCCSDQKSCEIQSAISQMLDTINVRFLIQFRMVRNCKNFMIFYISLETCMSLEVQPIGMPVLVNII